MAIRNQKLETTFKYFIRLFLKKLVLYLSIPTIYTFILNKYI